jgi:hypothetical protein
MRFRLIFGLVAALGSVIFACSSKNSAMACIPGTQAACNCPGTTAPGAQACKGDGTGFDACNCAGTTGSGGTTTTGTNTTTSGSPTTTSGQPPTSSGPTSGAGGMNPNQGKCDMGDPSKCYDCWASACAVAFCTDKVNKCNANAECKAIKDCVAKCPPMDGTCYNGCVAPHMTGTTDFFNLLQCEVCNPGPCYGDCNGKSSCSMMMP